MLAERLFPGASLDPVAGDASTRRFYRILPPGGPSRILMDYGTPFEGETDDVRLARIFEKAGLPVARIEHVRPAEGCLILEDLGSRTLEDALSTLPPGESGERERLYGKAIALAIAIATRGTAVLERSDRASGPALDSDRFRFEMDFFLEHYVGGLMGVRPVPPGLLPPLYHLADLAANHPRSVLCHRDFHSRNLMVRDDGSLTMVDIQDARRGPLGYDLASLVYDAYSDLDEDLESSLIESYRSALPDAPARGVFESRLDVVAAQRLIKALGTFGHQAVVLGRRRYLEGVPRTLARLARLLPRTPETAPVGEHLRRAGLLADSA
jgi:aminoglycoside/choline kinase family phosphotransferase